VSTSTTPSAWPAILENIRNRVSQQQFATWFQNLRIYEQSSGELKIRVPNRFFKEWLSQNYETIILDAVEDVTRDRPLLMFVLDDSLRPKADALPPTEPTDAPYIVTHRPRDLHINDHYTFDAFVTGPSNQLAHAAAVAVSEAPGKTYNPLFMYGSVGLGKSHLLQAICHTSIAASTRRKLAYLSCETFVNEFISAIQRNLLPRFRDRYRQLDVLLIDDIQFLSRAERSQEEFFHTFNDLYNAQKQIVLSSDQPPQEITGLQERLISRFKSGLITRIDPPSYEMRVAILHRKAELRKVDVPADVIEYVASVITTNIRELDGAITKVLAYASLLNQPITIKMARVALNEPAHITPPLSINDILRVVTSYYKVRISDLQSKKRTRSIVVPRQICMYLARSFTQLSLEEIGGYFGGRDHSTVLHAHDKIREEIRKSPAIARDIDKLQYELNVSVPVVE